VTFVVSVKKSVRRGLQCSTEWCDGRPVCSSFIIQHQSAEGMLYIGLFVCVAWLHAGFIGGVLGWCSSQHGGCLLIAARKHSSTSPLPCVCTSVSFWLHHSPSFQQVNLHQTVVFLLVHSKTYARILCTMKW